jgi:hypothetical protein
MHLSEHAQALGQRRTAGGAFGRPLSDGQWIDQEKEVVGRWSGIQGGTTP